MKRNLTNPIRFLAFVFSLFLLSGCCYIPCTHSLGFTFSREAIDCRAYQRWQEKTGGQLSGEDDGPLLPEVPYPPNGQVTQ